MTYIIECENENEQERMCKTVKPISRRSFEDIGTVSTASQATNQQEPQFTEKNNDYILVMANRTDPTCRAIHNSNPQYLISKIARSCIYSSLYWKEKCFGLTAESIIDKAIELTCVGGLYGGSAKPTEFYCLLLKLLQIQPPLSVVLEYLNNEEFKYLTVLAALYL
ncbi:pre-mRNA-splicing factor 38A-like [Danaus plexippus]|uniref:pre-mRNA-splicing factor 38A-like n=1 Tax=Danaus plexippus TaxID=13037 RepID=UPI002AAF9B9E|nr:pre-mRNA-splicing factor 38A-like [Danaus plexippus]